MPNGVLMIRSISPSWIIWTMVFSPAGPSPSLCLRTTVASMPLRCSTSAVPLVARISKPRPTRARAGKTRLRLSRLATETKTRPVFGSAPYAPACDLA